MSRPASESDTELEEFFDLSIDLLCIVGFDGSFKRVNSAFARALGCSKAEVLARSALEVTHPDDVEPSRAALSRLAEGDDLVQFESRIVSADGSVRWIEWNTRTMPDRDVVYGVGRDATDRRRADAELRDAQRLLEASRDELRRLADEQAALRRVATLVARRAPLADIFAAVGREAGGLLGADATRVVPYAGDEAARPAEAREPAVTAPIVVDGRAWGAIVAWRANGARLPETADTRLAGFTDLLATAVSDSAGRAEVDRLLAEQAALRRVATLVARETPPDALFAAVAQEVGELLGVDATHLGRYDPDGTVVSLAQWGRYPGVPIGSRFSLAGDSVSARVLRAGRAAPMDSYAEASGAIAETVREIGIRCSIGVPISVAGHTWGVMIVSSKRPEAFPETTEARLRDFTELVAAAISNAGARAKVRALADEQAALRRVATLVAQQTPQAEVFGAIAEEIGRLLGVDAIEMVRYEEDRFAAIVASAGASTDAVPVGTRVAIDDRDVISQVFRTRRAATVRSAVGTPIMVEGRLWGAMLAVTHDAPLAPDVESRIGQFTQLMATAIANAEARAEVGRLAHEQDALRRVATLVAQGPRPAAVFDAVTRELAEALGATSVSLARYDGDAVTVLAHRAEILHLKVGQRMAMQATDLTSVVLRTGRPARRDSPAHETGAIADMLRRAGIRSTVAVPVVVEGRIWGVLAASWTDAAPRTDTEERLVRFAELLDTAIANADSRDQLTASRARVLAAADDARRHVVRDLHDGAQQRLVYTIVTLKLAQQALAQDRTTTDALVAEALDNAEKAIGELRELSHGILPSALTYGGLDSAVDDFITRLDLPVDVDVSAGPLPRDIEASAYFIIAEALTNVAKHAQATRAHVAATVRDGVLALEIRDDGVGGADSVGHGLLGIADRVAALDGELAIQSTERDGTSVVARLPLPNQA